METNSNVGYLYYEHHDEANYMARNFDVIYARVGGADGEPLRYVININSYIIFQVNENDIMANDMNRTARARAQERKFIPRYNRIILRDNKNFLMPKQNNLPPNEFKTYSKFGAPVRIEKACFAREGMYLVQARYLDTYLDSSGQHQIGKLYQKCDAYKNNSIWIPSYWLNSANGYKRVLEACELAPKLEPDNLENLIKNYQLMVKTSGGHWLHNGE